VLDNRRPTHPHPQRGVLQGVGDVLPLGDLVRRAILNRVGIARSEGRVLTVEGLLADLKRDDTTRALLCEAEVASRVSVTASHLWPPVAKFQRAEYDLTRDPLNLDSVFMRRLATYRAEFEERGVSLTGRGQELKAKLVLFLFEDLVDEKGFKIGEVHDAVKRGLEWMNRSEAGKKGAETRKKRAREGAS
jgi:hypothetical protein